MTHAEPRAHLRTLAEVRTDWPPLAEQQHGCRTCGLPGPPTTDAQHAATRQQLMDAITALDDNPTEADYDAFLAASAAYREVTP